MSKRCLSLRTHVFKRDKYKCWWCGHAVVDSPHACIASRATVEHLIPRHLGGPTEKTNLVAACSLCNQARGRKVEAPTDADRVRIMRQWLTRSKLSYKDYAKNIGRFRK